MKKRIISLLLALSMMISLVPVSALANTGGGITPLAAGSVDAGHGLTINANGVPQGNDGANGTNWTYTSSSSGYGTLTLKSGIYDFSNQRLKDGMTINVETGVTAKNFKLSNDYNGNVTPKIDQPATLNNNGGTVEDAELHGLYNGTSINVNNSGTIKNSEFSNAEIVNEAGATIEGSSLVCADSSRTWLKNLGTVQECALYGAFFRDDEYGTITNCVAWGDNEFPEGVQAAEITIDGDARWTITDPRMPDRLATDKFYIVGSPTLKIQIWDRVKRTNVPLSDINGATSGIKEVTEDGETWYQFTPDSSKADSFVLNVRKEHQLTVTGGGVIKAINGTDTTGSPTTAQVKETLKVTLEAPEQDGKTFKEWKVTAGMAPTNFVYKRNEYYNLIDNPTSFYMPEGDVTLEATYYDGTLKIGEDGKPVTEGRKPYGNSGVQGDGWTYDGTTLKLNPESEKEFTLNGSWYLECDLEIGANATVKGTITFTKNVTNYGTIEKMEFGSIGGGVYPSLINNGTVKDCFIALASVTNNSAMENVSFVTCSKLENSAGAIIENAVVRTDDRNMRYSNSGKIDKAVFEFRPTGAETIRVLKAGQLNSNERVYAKVGGCTGGLSGTEVYIVGVPELKVKIADYIYANVTRPVTDVNGDKNYGGLSSADANGYHTFTVKSEDTELVLNKTISPTYNENLEIGADGKPVTENRKPYGNSGVQGDGWTYDGTTLTLSGSSWSFSKYPAVTCPVALSYGTALYGGVFENTVSGSGYITGGIFLSRVTVSAENINTGIFKTAPNGTTYYTVKAGDSSKLGVKVNGAEFVDFGTDEALVVNRIGNFEFSVQLRDANGDVVKIANINGKEIGSAYGSHYMNGGPAVEFTMPSKNVVLNQESTTKTYTLTVVDGKTSTGKTSEELKEGTEVAVDANVPDDKVFTGWTASDGVTLTHNGEEVDLSENHLVFNMPAKTFTLTANFETARTNILFNEDGTLNLDGVKNNSGDGWYYSEGALYLNPATATEYDFAHVDPQNKDGAKLDAVNVPIHVVNSTVTIAGGTFKAEVESTVTNATFKNCVFNGEVDIQTICNVDNCIFTKSSTITDIYIAENCLFEEKQDESKIAAKELTEESGATITATLENCEGEVSGTKLYFTGTPTLKVKVAGGIVEKANNKPVGDADANGWYTVTAAEDDDGIVLTKGEKTTPNPDDQPKTYTVTVKGGTINNETEVKAEKDIKLTVDVDEKEVPEGMTFDVWSIRFPKGIEDTLTPSVNLHDPHMTFTMPEADITIEAQYRSSELPGEDDGPSALGTMATVAVGGAAAGILVWQGVSLGVDSYLQLNLPKGVAVPTNRRELVKLLWETAGKPEAALPSLYSDVPAEEIELQKATRWAIDNGLVKPADDSDASRFDPDRYVTKYDVFGAWLKLKKLMKL